MIPRYSRPEMARIWSEENKFAAWLKVEIAAVQAWADMGVVPRDAADKIARNASFTLEDIDRYEREMHHDMNAFLRSVNGQPRRRSALGPPRPHLLRHRGPGDRPAHGRGRRRCSKPTCASSKPRSPREPSSSKTRCAWAAPTACTPSRSPSASSCSTGSTRSGATRSASPTQARHRRRQAQRACRQPRHRAAGARGPRLRQNSASASTPSARRSSRATATRTSSRRWP